MWPKVGTADECPIEEFMQVSKWPMKSDKSRKLGLFDVSDKQLQEFIETI